MKRIAILVLALLLASASALAAGPIIVVQNPPAIVDAVGIQQGTKINVAMTTAPAGYFATDLWGANGADLAIRALLHGYSTVTYLRHDTYVSGADLLPEGTAIFDGMALAGVTLEGSGDNRKYVISLMTDLCYNDGTPITAKDYIFSLLMSGSPLIEALGGEPRDLNYLAGYGDYASGRAQGLKGVRMIDQDTFSLEIDGAYLPYFYGISMLNITPYPIGVIAPGCDIVDQGAGCYIAGAFTQDLLETTLLDPEDGYLFNPRVTSGPYQLDGYEGGVVSLSVNPRFAGNYEGAKPHVERLTLVKADNEAVIGMLAQGEIDLASEIVNGDAVAAGMALRGESEIQMQSYPRRGLSYLALNCEKGVTADAAVRQAIARCVDKQAIIAQVAPNSLLVNGYYGLGQWMPNYEFAVPEGEEEGPDMVALLAGLATPYDPVSAGAMLAQAGWNLDATGAPYQEGVRYRRDGDNLAPLTVRWAKTDNQAADKIQAIIQPALLEAGIGLTVTQMPFEQVLQYFYRQEDRADYDMFFLASDFLAEFDPYWDYHTGAAYQGIFNTSGLMDEELMALAEAMRKTPASDPDGYAMKWLDFQRAWVEKMPLIPMYSSVCFEFFDGDIQGYDNIHNLNWGYAMPYVWIGEAPEAPQGEALGDDDLVIVE